MDKAIKDGLGKNTNINAVVKCFISYVQDIPNGTGSKIIKHNE